jgi:hypothetical protein
VETALHVVVLRLLPSPLGTTVPLVALALLVACAVLVWRSELLAGRAWRTITVASALIVAGHAITFVIAARTVGVTAPLSQMLPLALLVLLGAALPNIGGWGPREGVTAWAFAAAGLGASVGVATAVAYGVMVLFASLPGAAVLVARRHV